MGWTIKTPNGRYLARYRTPDGRPKSRTWNRKSDATRWLRDEQHHIDTRTWIDPSAGEIPFHRVAEAFMSSRVDVAEGTRSRDESYLRSLILPTFGPMSIARIGPSLVQTWILSLVNAGKAPETVRKAHQILSMCLATAINDGRLANSPCGTTRLPKIEMREMRFLTIDGVHDLAGVIDQRYRAMIYCGALAGLRFGEAAALQVSSLDLTNRRLNVTSTLSEVSGGPPRLGSPKTKASRRQISMPQALVSEMELHLAGHSGGEFLFEAPTGGAVRGTNWRRRVLRPAVSQSVGGTLRFHDLRHTHVALLIAANTHVKVVSDRLGHTSISTTINRYGHLYDGTDQAAADGLDELMAKNLAHSARTVPFSTH